MEKPISLQQFADSHKENYDLIRETVNLYNSIWKWQHQNVCAVCDKELTEKEKCAIQAWDFYYCCDEHAEYRKYTLIDPIRKKLGFSDRLYLNIEEDGGVEQQQKTSLSFGDALLALKAGKRVSREGWNGKGMWLALTPGSEITASEARSGAVKKVADQITGESRNYAAIIILPHIDMKSANDDIVVGWLASQTDMLSNDWCILD